MKAMKAMEVMKVMKTKQYQSAGGDQAAKQIIAEESKALTTFKMKAILMGAMKWVATAPS